jgi:DNA-binding helix-hairpin-helix protein with protein kinase domain
MLVDQNGAQIRLGRQIGDTGGEGNVYRIDGNTNLVAKIYHRPPTESKVAKLKYLPLRETPGLKECAAWPSFILFDERKQPRGFVMRAVSGKEVHHAFGTRDRVVDFPGKNWDFLLNTARNCAAAFDEVHAVGAIMGDVNEKNVLVQANGNVILIDCDSYQVANGTIAWTCDVGVPLWTPPELQGRNFKGLVRTVDHDLFGLAVLIFKLLFMGRHPYAGVPLNQSENLIEDSIKKRLYAFSSVASSYGVRPPPYSFPVSSLPEPYLSMFERAFRLIVRRPTAKEWVQALASLQQAIVQCARDASHKFPKFLSRCPWCEIAAEGGPLFFVSVDVVIKGGTLGDNAAAIWATISRIQRIQIISKNPNDFTVPPVSPAALPASAHRLRPIFVCGLILYVVAFLILISGATFLAIIMAVFATGMVFDGRCTPEFTAERKRRQEISTEIERDIGSLWTRLEEIVKKYNSDFDAKAGELRQAYQRYSGLDRERQTEMQKLEREKRQLQLNEFLRGQLISRAKIPGIGDMRKSRLLAFGVGSALDIKPNLQVPGFGPTNLSHLLNWRTACETRFRFEPLRPIPAVEVQRVNIRIETLRSDLLKLLKSGPASLTSLSAGAQGRFLQLQGRLEASVNRRAQARADISVV